MYEMDSNHVIQDLEQIEYCRGMLEKGMKPEDLPLRVWRKADIPVDVRDAIKKEELLSLGGAYGNRGAGDPVEYDHLRLILTEDTVEITVFNRGITLFTSDDEKVRRIHRVLCKLEQPGEI